MIKIKLLRKLLRVDYKTGKLYWITRSNDMFKEKSSAKSWNAKNSGREAFTTTLKGGYKQGRIFGKAYTAHRVILALYNGHWPDKGDHINHNRSDNRIENLREVTTQENQRNASISSNNKSGFTGVYWYSSKNKWHSQITVNYKTLHLGYFESLKEAIESRKIANAKYKFHKNHGS